jgi:predicted heme/steroid binding protein
MKIRKYLLAATLALTFVLVSCTTPKTTQNFTLTQLAQYDGTNGAASYIAVDGVVYDVTNDSNWTNGMHQGMHLAGTDCTVIFASSPHSSTILADYTIVGNLVG